MGILDASHMRGTRRPGTQTRTDGAARPSSFAQSGEAARRTFGILWSYPEEFFMGQSLPVEIELSRNPVATNCTELSVVAESCKWFPLLAKKLWPIKTASAVHHLTREPERSCYAWIEAKNDPPSRAFVRLLHTDQGWRVLEHVMGDSKQPWWTETVRARECSAAYEQRREQLQLPLHD
jgi:hypothetical protein